MKEIIVIGGGGHAKVVISILKKLKGYKVVGYTDLKDRGIILGEEYIGTDENTINCDISLAAIGIGITNKIKKREKIINSYLGKGFSFPAIISPDAIVNEDVYIGTGTVVMDGAVINSGTKIDNYSIINTKSSIDHDCKIGNYVHIAPGAILCGGVQVGSNSLIGAGSTVIQYKTIAENCIIGAGSVITKDCLESGTYVGIPARRIDE